MNFSEQQLGMSKYKISLKAAKISGNVSWDVIKSLELFLKYLDVFVMYGFPECHSEGSRDKGLSALEDLIADTASGYINRQVRRMFMEKESFNVYCRIMYMKNDY